MSGELGYSMDKILMLKLPDWLYGFIEGGWIRYKEMMKDPSLSLSNFFPFIDNKHFDSFEEFAEAVIEGLVSIYFENWKAKEKEGLKGVSEAIRESLKSCIEAEEKKKKKGSV